MLVAVDTNIPLDLARRVADVIDALAVIEKRIADARLIAPPTVALELAYLSEFAEEDDLRTAAKIALRSLVPKWKIQPVNLVPVGHGIVDAIAAKIRERGLLPVEETHDALILAESALLECSILLTSDAHLREVDHTRLSLLLGESHVATPVIARPRDIVRKFMPKR